MSDSTYCEIQECPRNTGSNECELAKLPVEDANHRYVHRCSHRKWIHKRISEKLNENGK